MTIRDYINACNANMKHGKKDRARKAFELAWAIYAKEEISLEDERDLFWLRNNFVHSHAMFTLENAHWNNRETDYEEMILARQENEYF